MEGEKRPHLRLEAFGSAETLPDNIRLTPWSDPLVDELGFGPRHMYTECVWLPVLGPTTSWLYRRLGSWATHNADGLDVDLKQMSQALGLGESLSRNGKLARALGRLVYFDIARTGAAELQVRTALPPLPLRLLKSLDPVTQKLHETYATRPHRDRNGLVT